MHKFRPALARPGGRRRAFTLVELIVVILVIAVLAAIAVLGYTNITDRAVDSRAQANLANVAKATFIQAHTVSAEELTRPLIRAAIEEHFPEAGQLPVIAGVDAAATWALLTSEDSPETDLEYAAGFDLGDGTGINDLSGARAVLVTAGGSSVWARTLVWGSAGGTVSDAVKYPAGTTPADILRADGSTVPTPEPTPAPTTPEAESAGFVLYDYDYENGGGSWGTRLEDAPSVSSLGTTVQKAKLTVSAGVITAVSWPTSPLTIHGVDLPPNGNAGGREPSLGLELFDPPQLRAPGIYVQGSCPAVPTRMPWIGIPADRAVGTLGILVVVPSPGIYGEGITGDGRLPHMPTTLTVDLQTYPCLAGLARDVTPAMPENVSGSYSDPTMPKATIGGSTLTLTLPRNANGSPYEMLAWKLPAGEGSYQYIHTEVTTTNTDIAALP